MKTLSLRTHAKEEFVDVTAQVAKVVAEAKVEEGLAVVFCPHTTAGVTVNECDDPAVREDIVMELGKVIPMIDKYKHAEGNSAAHIKAVLTGTSVQIPVTGGKMALGKWQGIFLCEFDGPRARDLHVQVMGS